MEWQDTIDDPFLENNLLNAGMVPSTERYICYAVRIDLREISSKDRMGIITDVWEGLEVGGCPVLSVLENKGDYLFSVSVPRNHNLGYVECITNSAVLGRSSNA
jgi:hypothetical protein